MPGRGGGPAGEGRVHLSADDIARRIGAGGGDVRRGEPEAALPKPPERSTVARAQVRLAHRPPARVDRGVLWRDAAAFAAIFLAIALGLQFGANGGPNSSRSVPPTQRALGATATPVTSGGSDLGPAIPTIGPVLAPGLGLEPSAGPRGASGAATIRPPARPTARPSTRVAPTPTPQPSVPGPSASASTSASAAPPTSPPPPTASLSCEQPVGFEVVCHDTSTDIQAGSEVWSTSDGGAVVTPANPPATVTITFSATGTYAVTVMVIGLDGTPATSLPLRVVIS